MTGIHPSKCAACQLLRQLVLGSGITTCPSLFAILCLISWIALFIPFHLLYLTKDLRFGLRNPGNFFMDCCTNSSGYFYQAYDLAWEAQGFLSWIAVPPALDISIMKAEPVQQTSCTMPAFSFNESLFSLSAIAMKQLYPYLYWAPFKQAGIQIFWFKLGPWEKIWLFSVMPYWTNFFSYRLYTCMNILWLEYIHAIICRKSKKMLYVVPAGMVL